MKGSYHDKSYTPRSWIHKSMSDFPWPTQMMSDVSWLDADLQVHATEVKSASSPGQIPTTAAQAVLQLAVTHDS